MPGNKPTKAELVKRVQEVVNLAVMGLNRSEIIRYIADKTLWHITDRTVDNYLARARRVIEEAAAIQLNRELGLGIMRLEDLYKRSVAGRDFKAALAIQKERHELLGLKKQTPGKLGEVTINVVHRGDEQEPGGDT